MNPLFTHVAILRSDDDNAFPFVHTVRVTKSERFILRR
jgi:hypothetical protein